MLCMTNIMIEILCHNLTAAGYNVIFVRTIFHFLPPLDDDEGH